MLAGQYLRTFLAEFPHQSLWATLDNQSYFE